jgi:hypothetical protein
MVKLSTHLLSPANLASCSSRPAATSSNGVFTACTAGKSACATLGVASGSSSSFNSPISANSRSGMRSGLPHNASSPEYGDQYAVSGGTKGSICHNCIPDSWSQSMNRYASAPISPMPYGPGSEVG